MRKFSLNMSVLEAAKLRIAEVFDSFEQIYVSFSAGKDSTIMLHLVAEEAIKRNRKFGVLFVDLEAQYKITIEHAKNCFELYKDNIDLYWVCLPLHLRNAVSVYQPHWICWEKEAEAMWVRELPDGAISDENYFPFFKKGMEFEEFVPTFGEWYSGGKKTACFVGIRTAESLNRYRSIASTSKERYNGHSWTTKVSGNVYNVYPVYDWKTEDIWVWHGKNPSAPSNDLYNYMHLAGLSIHQMRICQPYGDDQRKGLWLYHLIEPESWARVVARVNGANGGALYVEESGNMTGYRSISKPPSHTWQSFASLLVNSMPAATSEHYKNKIFKFCEWWAKNGYPDGIPDEVGYKQEADRSAPSWRRVCKALLRNDYWCKGLSFTQHKSAAYQKYLDFMKRKRDENKFRI